ncbi:MAG: ribonuclease H-like domain-containing protein [Dehalococcoidia bacterium]
MKDALSDGIVVDLETLRGPDEAGGWEHPERFGLAVAVTWDPGQGFREWFEGDAGALTEELSSFGRVVGFNALRFDYGVLAAYVPNVRALLAGKTVDILADVYQALGFRVSLDDLARATLGRGKTATGDQAIRWWREGKRDLVISYCRSDVALTRDLYLHGVAHGVIYYPSYGETRELRVSWRAS